MLEMPANAPFRKSRLIISGVILGIAMYFAPAAIIALALLLLILSCCFFLPRQEARMLVKIVFCALIIRLIAASAIMYFMTHRNELSFTFLQLLRDFDREIRNSLLLSDYFRSGAPPVASLKDISLEGRGFLHFGVFFYTFFNLVFGNSSANLLIGIVLSLLLPVLNYCLARSVFGERVAAFSTIVISIYPSFILWGCANIRMTLGIAGMLLMVYALMLFSRRNNPLYLVFLPFSLFVFSYVKEKFISPVLLFIGLGLFFGLKFRMRYKVLISAALLVYLCANPFYQKKLLSVMEHFMSQQAGFVDGQLGYYKIYDDAVYKGNVEGAFSFNQALGICLKALPKGALYFLFSPLPFNIKNKMRLLAYPYLILWYLIFLIALFGILKSIIRKPPGYFSLILVLVFFTVLFSLNMGNEGIAARFRDMLTPFFFIFCGYAIYGDSQKP
jgi:hypothetical protein